MAPPPAWMEVVSVDDPDPTLDLGAGEVEAITLAGRHDGALLLLDERRAIRIAQERRIRATGTLGILAAASIRGLVDLALSLDRLRDETNFRATPELYRTILERHRNRPS